MISAATRRNARQIGKFATIVSVVATVSSLANAVRSTSNAPMPPALIHYIADLQETASLMRYNFLPVSGRSETSFQGGLLRERPGKIVSMRVSRSDPRGKFSQTEWVDFEAWLQSNPRIPVKFVSDMKRLNEQYDALGPEIKRFVADYDQVPMRGARRGALAGGLAAVAGIGLYSTARRSKALKRLTRTAQAWQNAHRRNFHRR